MTGKATRTTRAARSSEGGRNAGPRQSGMGPQGSAASGLAELSEDEDGGDTQFVASVSRALSILNAFRAGEGALGNAELAERTGLTKPTVSRLAYTLVRSGYLTFNQRYRVYELGPAALALGNVALSFMDVRQLAKPLMRELARQADFNVGLGTRDGDHMIYTDACEGEGLVGLRLFAGSRIPIVTSAMGRAYLAGLEPAERQELLEQVKPQFGAKWPAVEKAVRQAVKEVESQGFCSSIGDWKGDIHGVGAPIRKPGGQVYALNLGGPAYLLPIKLMREELGPKLAAMARQIENTLASKQG